VGGDYLTGECNVGEVLAIGMGRRIGQPRRPGERIAARRASGARGRAD
jgi:hypothetical protein